MNKGSYTAVIVEGADREKIVFDNIVKIYFKNPDKYRIISFPAEQNIYMLWKCMEKDNSGT